MMEVINIHYLDIFGTGEVLRPCGLTTDESMNLYVAATASSRIVKFNEQGKFLMDFGKGEGGLFKKVGKLTNPTGVAVDKEGNCYAADVNSNCVYKFDAQGRFLLKFGNSGKGDGEFDRCRSLRLGSDGCLWVVDAYNNRI